MTGPILDIHNLRKSYGSVIALDGVSLTIQAGEIVGLLGPNGAGKTTLVSIICGLRRADSGRVEVNGVDALAHPEHARHHLGLAPQDLGIYPIDTVEQNLVLFGQLAGVPRKRLAGEIEKVAASLRLTDLLYRKAGELSGGQKRRLHTAIALLNDPPLILLDESTTGADVETRAGLLDVVKDLAGRGSAVLYSTHYLNEVEALDASVVILERGRVIARGSVPELVSRNGGSVIELTFRGTPPRELGGSATPVNGSSLRFETHDPGGLMARIVTSLGPDAARLQGIQIFNPSLETVYLALTGRRYESGKEVDVTRS